MSTPKTETAEAKSTDTPADHLLVLSKQSTALARLVARNESAMSELLEGLSHHSDTTVRKWVCAHANTPPEVLGKLGGQFPQQLLDNPALDFMILENPNLLRELPQAAKTSMLKRQTCPASFIELMAQDMESQEGMQLAIAMNPSTPAHVIQELKKSSYNKVKDAARQHIHAGNLTKTDAALEEAVSKTLSKQFVDRLTLPWAVMKNMEQEGSAEREAIRHLLMEGAMANVDVVNPHTTIERVTELLPLTSDKVRMTMARNPNATSAVLRKLVTEDKGDWWEDNYPVRETVARNPSTTVDVFRQLVEYKNSDVCEIIAENRNTPVEILHQLAQDKKNRYAQKQPEIAIPR